MADQTTEPEVELTAESLVRKGYLPRELPPPFTTAGLADLVAEGVDALPLGKGSTRCTRHNLARVGGLRRPLGIPNPRSFVALTNELETRWPVIRGYLEKGQVSISRPTVDDKSERAVKPRFRISELARLRPGDWRGRRFILRTDVSQFYPSLYTHAIPWVLDGKDTAKKLRNQTPTEPLDKALRDLSDGQTVGVPIGPDTSFVVAELLLSAVDQALESRLNVRGHRYFDDYEFAFHTRSDAETALAVFEDVLAEYELAINPTKTAILELPQPLQVNWPHELATFEIRPGTGKASRLVNDLIALFSRAAEISLEHPGALKYALLRSREVSDIDKHAWGAFQNLIWSVVSAEPTTMATAIDLISEHTAEGDLEVDLNAASEVIDSLILTHAPMRNASEVAWGLWAAIALEVEMTPAASTAVALMDDDVVALLALDAGDRGLFQGEGLNSSHWESLTDYDDVMSGSHWLLAYEASTRQWLEAPAPRVAADPFFKLLQEREVHFYDESSEHNPFTGAAGPLPGGLVPDDYFG